MKKGSMIFLGILVTLVLFGGIFGSSIWGIRCEMLSKKIQIQSTLVSNKTEYDKKWKTFKELAQIPKMQEQQFKSVYDDMMINQNRDTGLLVKMVKQDNPKLDTKLYEKLQDAILDGEEDFQNRQNNITDQIGQYNTYLINHPIVASILNEKQLDANDYVVTSEATERAFDTGKADEIDLLGE